MTGGSPHADILTRCIGTILRASHLDRGDIAPAGPSDAEAEAADPTTSKLYTSLACYNVMTFFSYKHHAVRSHQSGRWAHGRMIQ